MDQINCKMSRMMTNGHLRSLVVAMALIVPMATSVPLNESLSATTDSLVAYSEAMSTDTLLNDTSETLFETRNSTLNTSESPSWDEATTAPTLVSEHKNETTTTNTTTTTTTTPSTTTNQAAVATTSELSENDYEVRIKDTNEYADDRGFFETDHRIVHQQMTNHLGHGRVYVPNEVHGLIWENHHYMLSVLIPITCGIFGAFMIVCVAYGLRNCNSDNSHQHRQVGQAIRHRARSLRSQRRRPRVDHTLLLANSSDDENGRR